MVKFQVNQRTGALKKGSWSAEEDQKLVSYIKRYGIWNWNHMAKPAGLARTGKSCRLRWMNYLRPNIKHGNLSQEEVTIIIELQQLLGNRWSAIAAKLPGRTDNEVKNYWNTRLKKHRILTNQSSGAHNCESTSSSAEDTKIGVKAESVSLDSSSPVASVNDDDGSSAAMDRKSSACAIGGSISLGEEQSLSILLDDAYLEEDFTLMVLQDLWKNPSLTSICLGDLSL